MENIFYSPKAEISNRILKNARDYWNIKNAADFDPLVKLLIEALSTELFNVSNELKNLENKLLDKISRVLASDLLTSALPAHAILHATTVEMTETITEKDQFFYKQKMQVMEGGKEGAGREIFFSSLKPLKLFNADVAYIANGNNLFRVDARADKSFLSQTLPGRRMENNTVYLGIQVPERIDSYQGMNFYFDWRNYQVEENSYELLALSQWFQDSLPVNMAGYQYYLDSDKSTTSPFDHHDLLNLIAEDIDAIYSNRFLTIANDRAQPPRLQIYPKEFENFFSQENLQHFTVPILWFKVVFPVAITHAMLDELHIVVNAFPVVNKKVHDFKHRLKMMTDIVPLKLPEHDHFLSLNKLWDNLGNVYTEIPYVHDDQTKTGSFSIRYGGAERFDNRNAREVMDYLFELLRDEKAVFSAYGVDFLNHTLKELEQNISLIERKTKVQLNNTSELLNYLVVKPVNAADMLFSECWTTNAEAGNQIRHGSILEPFETSKINSGSIFLLSTSQGGRSRLDAGNRVQAFKYGLTSGNRVVSRADIVNFCFYELGDYITSVDIKKGLLNSKNTNEGFIKTTDVFLSPVPGSHLSTEEWEALLRNTRAKLQIRSVMNIHYRLILS
ncbi:hypothetical protein OQY15_03085 [Pedobacter sp. MC2016-15]|uniref:hypothetical protein n=1 Tax=Pedobacter sp. MC2016-15 TaxID=2994473 RepID=UPI0022462B00|nr:hypothetical protein [Pedobacter sp. MC2016-15]MCX2478058.1 hypothetical protein [Pedobacter sp. MC2016-15]